MLLSHTRCNGYCNYFHLIVNSSSYHQLPPTLVFESKMFCIYFVTLQLQITSCISSMLGRVKLYATIMSLILSEYTLFRPLLKCQIFPFTIIQVKPLGRCISMYYDHSIFLINNCILYKLLSMLHELCIGFHSFNWLQAPSTDLGCVRFLHWRDISVWV